MSANRLRLLIVLSLAAVVAASLAGVGWGFLAGAAIGAAVALLLGAAYLLKPLQAVRSAATHVASGELDARIRQRPPGPAGQMADALNLVAERYEAQMATAAEGQSRLAAALNSSIDAVAALDVEGRVLFANVAFEQVFGRSLGDVAGKPFAWVLADEAVIGAIRDSREHRQPKISVIEQPGRRFFQVVTTPIDGGGEWAVLIVFHDLTDVQRTEQMRRDFVANVSHELRTPLAALKSVVETLAEGAMQDESVANEFLRRADSEVDRLVRMVEELLELSAIESGQQPLSLQKTEIAPLLSEAAERLATQAERSQVSVTLELAPDLGSMRIDAARIERAVLNLLHNAIKFTPPNGSVTLSAQRNDGELIVTVRDSGAGIASSDLPRIFERFYKADQSRAGGGTGLGLALVKHAVEAHGGSVHVESEVGRGSCFTLRIPAES
ncbi:MAG TPA: ATP-binding protein [Dehalococcoidia bacterium]|nr:ATP-binding protein [Dehalococcoidia bacterium]